jgi:hypothetical protein
MFRVLGDFYPAGDDAATGDADHFRARRGTAAGDTHTRLLEEDE